MEARKQKAENLSENQLFWFSPGLGMCCRLAGGYLQLPGTLPNVYGRELLGFLPVFKFTTFYLGKE
jgi:hypothetical protein